MKKRQIDITVIHNPRLGEKNDRVQELLTYLRCIATSRLIIIAPPEIFAADNQDERHTQLLESLAGMAHMGTQITWICKGRVTRDVAFVSFREELELEDCSTWIPPTCIQSISSPLANCYLKMGILNYKAFRMLSSLQPATTLQKKKVKKQLVRKRLAHIAAQRGFLNLLLPRWKKPSKAIFESLYGPCQVMVPGRWDKSLTALEYTFKRWKSYSYSSDKLLAFYPDERLKLMSSAELQEMVSRHNKPGQQSSVLQ